MHAKGSRVSQKPSKVQKVVQVDQGSCSSFLRFSSSVIQTARQFHELLERTRTRTDRGGRGFSLVVFEVDGIRSRHLLAGELEQACVCRLRSMDNVGWIDHERLGILLPGISEKDAHRLTHDIRAMLSQVEVFPRSQVYSYPSNYPLETRNHLNEVPITPRSAPGYIARFEERQVSLSHRVIDTVSVRHLRRSTLPVWKRAMDIGGALIGLVMLSPAMLVVAFLVKVISPGPVLFRQERIGMRRKPFTMFKLRTMQRYTDSSIHERYVAELIENARCGDAMSQKPMTKLDDHPGIIPLGKVLRKTCLDEIPQLINVLRGEMSLIGPRPPLAYELQQYPEWCFERFSVPPGMTGLWQVSGKNRLSFNEMMRLDIRYVRRMSLWLDLLILLKTPMAIALEILHAIG